MDHRLPHSILPDAYEIRIEPDLDAAEFLGSVQIGAAVVDVWGLDAPFFLLAVVLVVIAPRLVTMPVREVTADEWARAGSVRDLLGRRDAVAAVLLSIALVLPAGMYEAIFARFMDDLRSKGLDPAEPTDPLHDPAWMAALDEAYPSRAPRIPA